MKIEIIKKNRIQTAKDWLYYAPPRKADHWKDGRSAKLLAEYVTNESFLTDVETWIQEFQFAKSSVLTCEPEAVTSLPGSGNGRNHDLLIEGKDFVIGIEAKVSESLGNLIKDEYNNGTQNKRYRIEQLLELLGLPLGVMEDCRYQLLTGLTGTVKAAEEKGKKKCLFLVIEFTGDVIKKGEEKNIKRNADDCDKFIASVQFPREVKCAGKSITCYMKRVTINVSLQKFTTK